MIPDGCDGVDISGALDNYGSQTCGGGACTPVGTFGVCTKDYDVGCENYDCICDPTAAMPDYWEDLGPGVGTPVTIQVTEGCSISLTATTTNRRYITFGVCRPED